VIDFRTYLTELFDRPFPVREYKRLGYGPATAEITYHAQDERGRDLMIEITNMGGGWQINFTIDGSHELTHSGKPFRVLSTVVQAVEMFLKWHKDEFDRYPMAFDMVSKRSESKRDVVYSALMKRFGKKYGYKITDKFVTNPRANPEDQRSVTTARLEEGVLTELFEKPYVFRYDTRVPASPNSVQHTFVYRSPRAKSERDESEDLVVVFVQQTFDQDRWGVLFDVGGEMGVTGRGDASRVFATVLDAIQRFIRIESPRRIVFDAEKSKSGSRVRLYTAMVKRFAAGVGYRLVSNDTSSVSKDYNEWLLERD